MAKLVIFFLASALCFTTLLHFAAADADDFDRFHIKGSVYCDTCRVQFMTRLSKVLEGNLRTLSNIIHMWIIYNR